MGQQPHFVYSQRDFMQERLVSKAHAGEMGMMEGGGGDEVRKWKRKQEWEHSTSTGCPLVAPMRPLSFPFPRSFYLSFWFVPSATPPPPHPLFSPSYSINHSTPTSGLVFQGPHQLSHLVATAFLMHLFFLAHLLQSFNFSACWSSCRQEKIAKHLIFFFFSKSLSALHVSLSHPQSHTTG